MRILHSSGTGEASEWGYVPAQSAGAPAEACGSLRSKTMGTSDAARSLLGCTVRPSQAAQSAGSDSEMSLLLRKALWRALLAPKE